MYEIKAMKHAEKYLKSCPRKMRKYIIDEMLELENDPFLGEQLKNNLSEFFSLHIGYQNVQYRIIYHIDEETRIICIDYIGKREDVYVKFKRLIGVGG